MSSAPQPMPLNAAEAFGMNGRVVIVTGAAGNIGSAIAEVFAVNGAKVICTDQAGERLTSVVTRLQQQNPDVAAIPCDLSKPEELKALVDGAVARFGSLYGLVNCGAIPGSGLLADEDVADFDRMFHTNVRSIWLLTKYCLEPMTAGGGGSIVNICSINGHRPFFFCALYSSTKAAVLAMTRELAVELAPRNIRVNSVSPGLIPQSKSRLTWLVEQLHEPYATQISQEFTPRVAEAGMDAQPLRRQGHGHDVAMACYYLCSPASRFVTGEDIFIDGGKHLEIPDAEARFQGQQPFWKQLRERLMSFPDSAWKGDMPKWLVRFKQQQKEQLAKAAT